MTKGQGISMNVIVISAMALSVLIIITALIFKVGISELDISLEMINESSTDLVEHNTTDSSSIEIKDDMLLNVSVLVGEVISVYDAVEEQHGLSVSEKAFSYNGLFVNGKSSHEKMFWRLYGMDFYDCSVRVPYPKKYSLVNNTNGEVFEEVLERPEGMVFWDGDRYYIINDSACKTIIYELNFTDNAPMMIPNGVGR